MNLDDIYTDKIKPLKHSHNWNRIWNDVLLSPKIPEDSITSWYDSVAHTSLFRYILCKKPYAGPYQEFSYQKNQTNRTGKINEHTQPMYISWIY